MGFFTAPRAFDLLRSHKVSLRDAGFAEIEDIFQKLEADAGQILKKEASGDVIRCERMVYMRFVGQGSEMNVGVPGGDFAKIEKGTIRRLFDDAYEKLYGRTYPDSEVEFINFKVRASLPEKLLQLPKMDGAGKTLDRAIKGERLAYSPISKDFVPFTVYDRYHLYPSARFPGPAIIEEKESTLIVGEGSHVSVDDYGFLWVDMKEVC
jgi:N-methylhydantoinase A